eukprot:11419303-Alexandrium_andersonii.AAC.1
MHWPVAADQIFAVQSTLPGSQVTLQTAHVSVHALREEAAGPAPHLLKDSGALHFHPSIPATLLVDGSRALGASESPS